MQNIENDFKSFKSESLSVDYLNINISKIGIQEISCIASYLQKLGFNCYQQQLESNKSRQHINKNTNLDNQFEAYFISRIPYQKDMIQLQFPGISAQHFYQLIKKKKIKWDKFPNPKFSRLDLVYQRFPKSDDPISNQEFINSCYLQLQELHPFKNLESKKTQKGLITKIGNRRSAKHYRIYTSQNNSILRFEAEMKNDLINDLQDLLITSSFDEEQFERKLTYQFFKHSFDLFNFLNQPSHIDWLMVRVRSYQYKDLLLSESYIPTHYLNQLDFKLIKEKQYLITLLRLLTYLRNLPYETKRLKSQYRCYEFAFSDFLKYNNSSYNSYQIKKLKQFFDLVKQNFIIESFSDNHYRMLVTIPDLTVYKSQENILMVEIWIAEDLIHYLYPFVFSDLFYQKLTKLQFQVLFHIVQIYSINNIRKEYDIQAFIENYPASLNNKQKTQIKTFFSDYIKTLYQEGKLRDYFIDLSSNQILNITDLDSSHSRIAIFETIKFNFST